MFKKMISALFLIFLAAGSLLVWKCYSEQPANIIKSAVPMLDFTDHEILYSNRDKGVFGGTTIYLIKISDIESQDIINNCENLGFTKQVYDYKDFTDDLWSDLNNTKESLGVGMFPACFHSSRTKLDRSFIIIDRGYIYFQSSYL
ncbi:hypothetical protein [Kiloniella laminariae]|uniref:hypothetical protein n=1 Tax=Kiloniella laminariae TaxID=454162 RepID=UPI0003777FFF|nr:hypothetical protein [Kiloniella laminariae]